MAKDLDTAGFDRPYKIGRLLFNADQQVLSFVKDHIGVDFEPRGEFRSIGVLDNDDMLICGVIYHDFLGRGCTMSGAASRRGRWTSRKVMAGIFAYAFGSLELHRVTCLVSEHNRPSRRWCEKAGFKEEGRLREIEDDGSDWIVFGLLKPECRWGRHEEGKDAKSS